jgi:hypothetical protein
VDKSEAVFNEVIITSQNATIVLMPGKQLLCFPAPFGNGIKHDNLAFWAFWDYVCGAINKMICSASLSSKESLTYAQSPINLSGSLFNLTACPAFLSLCGSAKVFVPGRIFVFKNTLPSFDSRRVGAWSFMREKSNTCKRVFRNIEKFILVFEVSSHIWGYAVVCSEIGRNLYPYIGYMLLALSITF